MKKIQFDIESAELLEESSDSQFATAKLLLFSSGENRHGMVCQESVLRDTAETSYEKPIIFEYSVMTRDFGSHNENATVPAGFILKDSAEFGRLPDQRLSLTVLGKIWKRYSGKFLQIFKENNRVNSKLSVEMDLLESENLPSGLIDMKSFAYSAACILGENVTEASPSANIQMLSFSEEKKEYDEAYKKEFGSKYENIDMSIPPEVKKNVELGLSLYKKYGIGGNSVILATARNLSKNDKTSHEKIRHIAKTLKGKKFGNVPNNENSDLFVTYMLYGGLEGKQWAEKIEQELDKSDESHLSYFSDKPETDRKENKLVNEDEVKEKEEEMAVGETMASDTAKDEEKESPEQEKSESPEEEQKEKDEGVEKDMSLDANLDFIAVLSMLEDETEAYAKVKQESEKEPEQMNYSVVAHALYSKMCKLAAMCGKFADENKAYMAENEDLKKFKADVEQRQYQYEVDYTLKSINESVDMPKADMEMLSEESKKFSLETVDAWKNMAKAHAFSFSAKAKKGEDSVKRYGFPWGNREENQKKSLWD